jgi:hypothetical protein
VLFRRWERDCQTMTQAAAAKALGVTGGFLSVAMRAYHWRARADAAQLGQSFHYPPGPAENDSAPPAELPPDLAAEVRRREWLTSLELATASAEALRRWRESKKTPTLTDIARLLELADRLSRLAAGMGPETATLASAVNTQVKVELELALNKAYGPVVPVEAEVIPPQPPTI